MNQLTEQIIEMQVNKAVFYSTYVDCLSRVITELIENDDGNLMPYDVANLAELLTKYSNRLHKNVVNIKSHFEF